MIITYPNGFTRDVHSCLGYMQAIEVYWKISDLMEKQSQQSGAEGTIELF